MKTYDAGGSGVESRLHTLQMECPMSFGRQSNVVAGHLSVDRPACIYSFFNREMLVIEISLGQTASQACVNVQLPNPSLSIWSIMASTRVLRSGTPWGNSARWATFAETKSRAEEFLH